LFVESVHRGPGEGNARLQVLRPNGQIGVLPGRSRGAFVASANGIPGRETEIWVARGAAGGFQRARRDVRFSEAGHRIVAGFEEEEDVFAIRDPGSAEANAHAPTQGLRV
jgi:hypothetical protein